MSELRKIPNLFRIQFLFLIVFVFTSCAKDTDLLLAAVINEPDVEEIENEDVSDEGIPEEEGSDEVEDSITVPYISGDAGNKDVSADTALRVFYVAVDGQSSNDGLSEETPIDVITAFNVDRIEPGDLYWLKAGDYGKINIDLTEARKTAGTEENPIGWIGYKNTPGDIRAFEGPTVKWDDYIANGHDLDSTQMPTFTGSDANAPNFLDNETAIDINYSKEYIVIRNLQIRQYRNGIEMEGGSFNIFDNIIIANNGFFADIAGQGGFNTDLEGHGIRVNRNSSHIKISNSYAANMAKTAFSFKQNSSYNLIEWSEADTDNDSEHNPQDYFFHSVGEYNVFLNIKARKLTESNHSGHGLCFNWDSYQGWGAKNNYAENVEILNTGLHFDGEHTHDNTVKDLKVWEDRDHYIYGASIVFMDGTYNNTVDNATLSEGNFSFLDSGAHVDNGNAGHNNIISNTTVSNTDKAIRLGDWSTEYPAYENKFINCTFKDVEKGLFQVLRANYGFELIDCNVENVTSIWYEDSNSRDFELDSSTIFKDCNFWNSEIPSSTSYKVSGTTEKSPSD